MRLFERRLHIANVDWVDWLYQSYIPSPGLPHYILKVDFGRTSGHFSTSAGQQFS